MAVAEMGPFLVAALLVGAAFFLTPKAERGAEVLDMTKPRGIRLNNPGNIRHGDNWQGMAPDQPDASFINFKDPRYGYRAMVRILHSYRRRGIRTLGEIIQTWAPPVENDTAAYVAHVEQLTGLQRNHPITLENKSQVVDLLDAITRHENSNQTFDRSIIERGYELA